MYENADLSFLCERKYALLARLREEGQLSEAEAADLAEIEAKIVQAQKREGDGGGGGGGQ